MAQIGKHCCGILQSNGQKHEIGHSKLLSTRDLPGVALEITFFTTLFTKKKLNFWTNAPFCKFYNMIVKTSQQWFKINVKNAFGCPLRLGLYLKVECMVQSETNLSRTPESQRLLQGAICHVWTSQFNKHRQQSQKQLQKYNIRDCDAIYSTAVCFKFDKFLEGC